MYETRKAYMVDENKVNVKEKNDIFKYPIINTVTQKEGCNILYSKEKKGHFGIPKVIWSNGAGTYPIIDDKGIYGLTQFAYAILENDYNVLNKLKIAFLSNKFKNIMEDCAVTEQSINYKIIALFKKDFYKYFLPKNHTS